MNNPCNAPYPKLIYPKHDAPVGVACVPCESENSCCLFCGEIVDASNTSRKISWPYDPTASKRLLVIANMSEEGNTLVAKVNINRTGNDCKDSTENRISYLLTDEHDSNYDLRRQIANLPVTTEGNELLFSLASAANISAEKMTGWNTKPLLAMFAIGHSLSDLNRRLAALPALLVTPQLCVTDAASGIAFEVVPLPQFKLEGGVEWAALVTLNSVSPVFTREFEDKPYGKLTYANQEISLEATKKTNDSSNVPSKGVLGLLGKLTTEISTLQIKQEEEKQKLIESGEGMLLNNSVGSRVTISAKLNIGGQVELKAKAETPDLELAIRSFEALLSVAITGTIDVIQIASQALTPAIAMAIQKARQAAARENQAFNGYIKADLIFGCESEVKLNTGTINRTIPAQPTQNASWDVGDVFKLEGGVRLVATAELGIHIGGEVWGVSAQAGANGSLHTAWQIQLRARSHTDPDERFQYRQFFEGLVAEVNVYAKMKKKDAVSGEDDRSASRENTVEDQANLHESKQTLFQRIEDNHAEAASIEAAANESNRRHILTLEEAKEKLHPNNQSGFMLDLAELERLEKQLTAFPTDTDNQLAMDHVLEQVSERYHRLSRDSLGFHQLLAPTVHPITYEDPEWITFNFFGDINETEA